MLFIHFVSAIAGGDSCDDDYVNDVPPAIDDVHTIFEFFFFQRYFSARAHMPRKWCVTFLLTKRVNVEKNSIERKKKKWNEMYRVCTQCHETGLSRCSCARASSKKLSSSGRETNDKKAEENKNHLCVKWKEAETNEASAGCTASCGSVYYAIQSVSQSVSTVVHTNRPENVAHVAGEKQPLTQTRPEEKTRRKKKRDDEWEISVAQTHRVHYPIYDWNWAIHARRSQCVCTQFFYFFFFVFSVVFLFFIIMFGSLYRSVASHQAREPTYEHSYFYFTFIPSWVRLVRFACIVAPCRAALYLAVLTFINFISICYFF